MVPRGCLVNAWAVTWMRKPYSKPFILDVDSLEMAAEIGIRLNYQPTVYDIKVTTLEYEPDAEEMAVIQERIKYRLMTHWATSPEVFA